jgi:hypothetical protein
VEALVDLTLALVVCHVSFQRPPAEPPPATSPHGSIYDLITLPPSPTTAVAVSTTNHDIIDSYTPPHGLVFHIHSRRRIFGLCRDSTSSVIAKLMDGGANICVAGDLSILVDTVDIDPMPISVAVAGDNVTSDDCCTKRGYTPQPLHNGTLYWQLCYYCANVVETIISPQAVVASSDVYTSWTQTGFKDGRPGLIRFDSADGSLTMSLCLDYVDGLYYCTSNTYTIEPTIQPRPRVHRVVNPKTHSHLRLPSRCRPTTKS